MREDYLNSEDNSSSKDKEFENILRPKSFKDFYGQEQILNNIKIFVKAAKNRNEPLDHVILHGPPGLGKTTLSHIIANELGSNLKATSGPVLEKAGDLAGLLTNLEEGDVLFIDEIHRLNNIIEEYLYSAMEDYKIDLMIDSGPSARSVQIKLNTFTLIGATTRSGLLSSPLRSRFAINFRLEYYNKIILQKIINRSSKILNIPIEEKASKEIALRSRGTPRILNNLLRRIRDFAEVEGDGKISHKIAKRGLNALKIDKKVIGVVQFLDKVDGTVFDEKNVEVLEHFANLMAKFFQVSKSRKLLGEEFGRLKEQYLHRYTIVGESKAIQKCIAMAEKVADSKASVLLTGESGTGKELFAHLVHDRSQRQNKPFVSVSCGALPASILERELFGNEKGAFTGADTQKIGLFEAAHTGTLFLDEIGEMPLDMQVKLLRVIQEESFIRLGGTETIKVDVRLITATNLDLDKEVREGNFRQDLFYRINVIKITLPPLRDKLEDISDLLTYFIKKHSPEKQPIKNPGKGLVSHLMSYSWPGNIRELENSVERAIVLTDEDELLPEAFPFEASQAPIELNVGSTLKQASDLFRRTFISNTLKSTSGNRTKAARILDVQRSYLSRLIKELEIK